MTPPEDPRRRLGRLLEERRAQLGMYLREVAEIAGISTEGVRGVRDGSAPIRPTTKAGVERALRWEHGSIDAILAGDDPTPIDAGRDDAGTDEAARAIVEQHLSDGTETARRGAIAVLEARLADEPDPANRAVLRRYIALLKSPLPPPEPEVDKRAG